jgi:membrane protein
MSAHDRGGGDVAASVPTRGPLGKHATAFVDLVRDAGIRWSDDNCLRLGASLAYYAVFSIFPLLLLSVTVVGFFLGQGPETRAHLLDSVARASSPEFRTIFDETLSNMQTHQRARGVGAVVGVVMLVIGASAVFSDLQATMNQIWRVKPPTSLDFWQRMVRILRDKVLSFVVVAAAALAILASLVVSAVVSFVNETVEATGVVTNAWMWVLLDLLGSVSLLTVVISAMFRLIPQTKIHWRDVFGGAFLTAVLLTAIKRLLGWYLAHLSSYAAYGAVGGFLGLLTWIYLASLFLFYGAEFAALYAERHGTLREVGSRAPDGPGGESGPASSED